MSSVPVQRSRSPVDQIVEEAAYQCHAVGGTDSPGSTSGTSSSGSSGYPASQSSTGAASGSWSAGRRQHRLSGHSCESGVASFTSSRLSYLSVASGSSHDSINRLPEDNESAYASIVNFAELYENGYTESEIVHTWLCELRMEDYWELFNAAGYDMPTISRMTPEDLTAIGITQPVIRKRLTAEISKLRISDGIPNFIPDNVVDWLQHLQLEEYYDALTADGYYNSIDHVMEITWEDLEETGIKKLGHQKKVMLAIDRLKKLKLAAKRSAQQNAELFQSFPSPAEHYESHASSSVAFHAPSKPCVGPQKSPSYILAAISDSCHRPGVWAAQPWSPVSYQPEMVAIQVKRSAGVQSPAIYDAPVLSPAGYESFHGVPAARDMSSGRIMSPYDDTNVMRMRRASGDSYSYVSVPCCTSPYSMMTPPSSGSVRLPSSRASAPSTPLHTTSRLTPSNAVTKKTPPVPPQRTNSVKVNNTSQVADGSGSSAKCGSLDRTSKNSRQSTNSVQSITAAAGTPLCSTTMCTTPTALSTGVETGSTGDCSTLPFANENIGTIRQRGSSASASSVHRMNSGDDDSDSRCDYDEYSGTVRRRVTGKRDALQEDCSNNTISRNPLSNEKSASTSGKQQLGNTAEFTDIDNLFDGIAHELNELLTSAVDS